MRFVSTSTIIFTLLVLFLWIPVTVSAEDEHSETFIVPDMPEEWLDYLKYRNDYFSIGGGLAVLADYTAFSQDAESIAQVGKQKDKAEFRGLRLLAGGTLHALGPLTYFLAAEYKGFEREEGDPWFSFTDASLTWNFRNHPGRLTLGKQKEPFVYEMSGAAVNLPHHERLLEPFYRSRNIGLRYSTSFIDKRMGLAFGWYNDWFIDSGDISDNGNQFSIRLHGLPLWKEEGKHLLHLGISARYFEGDFGKLHYRGRPGSNVASYYVDTGDIDGDNAYHGGIEVLWQRGQYTFLAEYAGAHVNADNTSNPDFHGWYATTSYVFNGDLRPYSKEAGYSGKVQPYTKMGAFEPFVRYGYVDLDDEGVNGGVLRKWYVGLNWWATKSWKTSIGYGHIELDRFGFTGTTEQVLLRLQWISAF